MRDRPRGKRPVLFSLQHTAAGDCRSIVIWDSGKADAGVCWFALSCWLINTELQLDAQPVTHRRLNSMVFTAASMADWVKPSFSSRSSSDRMSCSTWAASSSFTPCSVVGVQ